MLLKKNLKNDLQEREDPKVFIKYSSDTQDFYQNIEQYIQYRKS